MKKIHIAALLFFGLVCASNAQAHVFRGFVSVGISGCFLTYPTFGNYNLFLSQPRRGTYGALAYSVGTGLAGWSSGWRTQADAEAEASYQCASADCQVQVWFRSACGAVAVSRWNPSIVGWAYAGNAAYAQNLAIRQCQIRNGVDCYTRAWACSQ